MRRSLFVLFLLCWIAPAFAQSTVRVIYQDNPPPFPATDQHPDAKRYGPLTINDKTYYVDAIGGAPTVDQIAALLTPPAQTPKQKIESATGLSIDDIKALLANDGSAMTAAH